MNKISTKAVMAILAPLFFASSPFSMGEIRIGDTPARRIAKETTLRGKYVDGQCLPFALALHARFRAAGIPSKVITFRYETLPRPRAIFGEQQAWAPINERGGIAGAHAVVAYEDQGRTYLMDNQCWQPKWIHSDSPYGMARQFSGMDTLVAKARVVANFRSSNAFAARTRAARLFRAHAPSLRQQFIAQSSGYRLRLRMATAGPRYGFVAPKRRRPLREEDFRQAHSPGICRNERRLLFRASRLAFR
jgi:hypothetical protein